MKIKINQYKNYQRKASVAISFLSNSHIAPLVKLKSSLELVPHKAVHELLNENIGNKIFMLCTYFMKHNLFVITFQLC